MGSAVAELLAEERRTGLARLAGSRLRATVPVREPLVARLISQARLPSLVRGLNVRFLPGNHVIVEAEVQVLGFRKRLEMALKVAASADPGPPRTIRLVFVERSLLSSAAGLAGPILGGLADGIGIRDGVVTVDLDTLAARAGVRDLAGHLREVAIDGQEGVLWLEIDVEVADQAKARPDESRSQPHDQRAERDGGLRVQPREIAELLRGARLEVTLRVEESLANAALETLVADVRSQGPPAAAAESADWRPLLESLEPPRVRFEAGVLIVEGRLAL